MKALPRLLFALLLLATPSMSQGEVTFKSTVIDPETHAVTETIADSKGKILRKTTFYFDENNWAKSAIHYDTEGNVRYKEVNKRDGAGHVIETWIYGKDDKVLGRRTFTYTADGKQADVKDFDAQGRPIAKAVRATAVAPKRNQSRGRPDKKR